MTRKWLGWNMAFTLLASLAIVNPTFAQNGSKGGGGKGGGGNDGGSSTSYQWVYLGPNAAYEIKQSGDIVCGNGYLCLTDGSAGMFTVDILAHLIAEGVVDAYDPLTDSGAVGINHYSMNESRELVGYVNVRDSGQLNRVCFYYCPGSIDYTPSSDSEFVELFTTTAESENIVINNNGLVAGTAVDPEDSATGLQLFLWTTATPTVPPIWLGSSDIDGFDANGDRVKSINDGNVICGDHRLGNVEYCWTFSLETGFVGVRSNGTLVAGYSRDINAAGTVLGSAAASRNWGSAYDYEAFRTTSDGGIDVVSLPRQGRSFAHTINSAGDILGHGDLSRENNTWRPFVYTASGDTDRLAREHRRSASGTARSLALECCRIAGHERCGSNCRWLWWRWESRRLYARAAELTQLFPSELTTELREKSALLWDGCQGW